MIFTSFEGLVAHAKAHVKARRVVVAAAQDEHTLEAVMKVRAEGIVVPVLVGDKAKIQEILAKMGETVPEEDLYDAPEFADSAALAVHLVREGKAHFIMKGKLDTSDILRAVVNKEHGLGQGRTMSHMAINQIPAYHKLLVTTDGGMLLAPTLAQKKDVILNAVEALRALGYEEPKVGVLAAAEKVNPKSVDSTDAAALKEMWQAGAKMAGLVVGAKCPIVVTSRGSSSEEKYNALCLAASMTQD